MEEDYQPKTYTLSPYFNILIVGLLIAQWQIFVAYSNREIIQQFLKKKNNNPRIDEDSRRNAFYCHYHCQSMEGGLRT
jgi:hypothetical protein